MLTPDDVNETRFSSPPIGKRGYDMNQVDLFLDRLEATLRGLDDLTAEQVHEVAFGKPAFGKRGYNVDEVDRFLDLAEAHLAGGPDPEAPEPLAPPTQPIPRSSPRSSPRMPRMPQPGAIPPGMVAPKKRWWRR